MSLLFNNLRRTALHTAKFTKISYLSTIRFAASHEYIKVGLSSISFYSIPYSCGKICCQLQMEGDIGTVGITDHAASALGDIVYVDLPAVGTKFAATDSFGSVESVKAASDVYMPVAGEVVAVNNVKDVDFELDTVF